jgi:hemolysin activation/secretion protein
LAKNKRHAHIKSSVNTNGLTLLAFAFASLAPSFVYAVQLPTLDSGSLMQEQERQVPVLPAPNATPDVVLTPLDAETSKQEIKIKVVSFEFEGATKIANTVLQSLLASELGKELTMPDLQRLGDRIAEHYRRSGYLAKVYLPEQDLNSGSVKFVIIESNFGSMIIDDSKEKIRLREHIAQKFGSYGQELGKPLNVTAVQRATNIMNDIPGVAASAMLSPGQEKGATNVVMKLVNRPALNVMLQADNFGNHATGAAKVLGYASVDNYYGYGEQFTLLTTKSQGSEYGRAAVTLPIGYNGLRVGINFSALNYDVVNGTVPGQNVDGKARYYGLEARYPIVRSNTSNLFVVGSVEKRSFQDDVNNIQYSDRQLDIFGLELNGNTVDSFGGGGYNSAMLNFHAGNFDQNNQGAKALDQLTKNSAGNYSKINWALSRLQRITGKDALWLSANGQQANDNLDSSEKLSLGGPYGVRAYPVTEALGDEGYLLTAELRHNFTPQLQAIAFYDYGSIKLNHQKWATFGTGINSYDLEGVGIGASWTKPADYSVRFVFSHRLGSNPAKDLKGNDNDGTDRFNRIWVSFIKFL